MTNNFHIGNPFVAYSQITIYGGLFLIVVSLLFAASQKTR